MDISDEATENEERDRAAAIANARNLERHPLTEKRRAYALARANAKAKDALSILCENCNDDLPADAADIFCCKECLEDWEKRERTLRRLGRNF